MGVDYSYEIFLHEENAGRLIASVAAACGSASQDVTIERWQRPGIRLTGRDPAELRHVAHHSDGGSAALSVWFDEDAALREFTAGDSFHLRMGPGGGTQHSVGSIYLSVRDASQLQPGHWEFRFVAATAGMSRLFLQSDSVRRFFAGLAISSGATLSLLDVEEGHHIVQTVDGVDVSAQPPEPCVLWNGGLVPTADVLAELRTVLAGGPPGERILPRDHPGAVTFSRELAAAQEPHSELDVDTQCVMIGPVASRHLSSRAVALKRAFLGGITAAGG